MKNRGLRNGRIENWIRTYKDAKHSLHNIIHKVHVPEFKNGKWKMENGKLEYERMKKWNIEEWGLGEKRKSQNEVIDTSTYRRNSSGCSLAGDWSLWQEAEVF